jgi:membrane protease YdiL (CAAX protease family)
LIPLLEELFFRYIIINEMINTFSMKKKKTIIFIQALLFYFAHLIGYKFGLNIFLLGIINGFLFIYSGSFISCYIMHILYNTIGFIFTLGIVHFCYFNHNVYVLLIIFFCFVIIIITLNMFSKSATRSTDFIDMNKNTRGV